MLVESGKTLGFLYYHLAFSLSQTMEGAVKCGLWKECICHVLKYAVPHIMRIDTQTKYMQMNHGSKINLLGKQTFHDTDLYVSEVFTALFIYRKCLWVLAFTFKKSV